MNSERLDERIREVMKTAEIFIRHIRTYDPIAERMRDEYYKAVDEYRKLKNE